MDTPVSDQAFCSPSGIAAPSPPPPDMTEAAPQADNGQHQEGKKLATQIAKSTEVNNTTASEQASNGQTSRPPRNVKWVAVPPGMTEELRQAKNRQYWEDRKLADETAKITEFNKNITISDQTSHNQAVRPSSRRKKVSMFSSVVEEAR
ncbi:hypothetical protein C8A01DRAFT_18354 [Parachaetomium inaequale]|uniref:Uncharacterized protein n=1 Tax=Parachaetomium inaequale TaxID=2588326 RepID=A0AAN6PDV0_9PEZI|nr:hypothetical protein C8A01DRAFT_18354 [Parachaetomium inaequale]